MKSSLALASKCDIRTAIFRRVSCGMSTLSKDQRDLGGVSETTKGSAATSPSTGAHVSGEEGPVHPPRHHWFQTYVRQSPLLSDPEKKKIIDRMIRVDHAGELGARRIYAGQLAVFRGTTVGTVIDEMANQELKHLNAFDRLIVERRVRPTAFLPIWHVAGYALGLGTALLGKEAAMACTVAVEEVIAQHYNDQIRILLSWEDEQNLRAMFREFRDDELEHKETGIEYDAEKVPFYRALSSVIKAGCRAAISISERV